MTAIYTETFGTGKPIVLAHGWAMHSGIWFSFAKELAKRYQVTLIDLPGHGHSDPIMPFTLETVAMALAEAIPDEPCCWLGWSLGAEIVLEIANKYPGRVERLILLAGTPCFVKKTDWPGMGDPVLDNFAASLKQDSQGTLLRFLSLQIKGVDDHKALLQKLISVITESPVLNPQTLQEGLTVLKETDLRKAFAGLTIPVSVILGQLDTLVPVAVGQQLQALFPTLELTIIDRAGHVPFLTHQERVVNAVYNIMDKG